MSFLRYLAPLLVASVAVTGTASDKSPRPEPRMSFIENDAIRLGVDLNLGGAITWLSKRGGENMVNSWDLGRQIQMSYYSGPQPFKAAGQEPAANWAHLGWNPIQAGDDFGNGSKTLESRNDGRSLYTKSVPMQWPLNNVPGECTFECWLELEGPVVKMHCRLNNARADTTQYRARLQELPAVYTNAPFHRLMSYVGDQPYAGGPIAEIPRPADKPDTWSQWWGTERWAALINDEGWGLGLCNPDCLRFTGGFAGKPGPNDPHSLATGYIAGQALEILDHNIVHEYDCEIIVGTLAEIRARAVSHLLASVPAWRFDNDRQGWRLNNAADAGWPLKGFWDIRLEQNDPQLISPDVFISAEKARQLVIRGAIHAKHPQATVFWRHYQDGKSVEGGSINFPVDGGGGMREYHVNLAQSPDYRGIITELRFDPVPSGSPGDWARIESIAFEK